MRLKLWFALAALAGLGVCRTVSQVSPDIFWITNGPDAHFGVVRSVAFSSDSFMLASGASDSHAKVWSIPGGVLVRDVDHGQEEVMAVGLSPDGSLLPTGSAEGRTRMWQVSDGRRLWQTGQSDNIIRSVAFTKDGLVVASASYYHEIGTHDPLSGFGVPFTGHEDDVTAVVFLPDATQLASSSFDGTAKIWRVLDRTVLHTLTGHSYFNPTNEEDVIIHTVWSVDFSPDGALLATSGADNTIRLWRVNDGTQVGVIESPGVGLAKFSADGTLLLTLNGGAINFYRVVDGQLLATYPNARATCLDVASNGRYFAYGTLDGSVAVAYLPVVIQSMTQAGGKITLRWQGGSGLYRVQASSQLNKGKWHYLGPPTTNTTFTHSAKSHLFYRVQSLPNP